MDTTKRYRATGLGDAIRDQGRLREWVASQAGVHASLITHALAGRRTVSEEVAAKIAAALGADLFLLFEPSSDSDMASQESKAA